MSNPNDTRIDQAETETSFQKQERIAKFLAELREKNGPPNLTPEEQNEIQDRLNTELRNMNRARRLF